jgi:hypothetical protein
MVAARGVGVIPDGTAAGSDRISRRGRTSPVFAHVAHVKSRQSSLGELGRLTPLLGESVDLDHLAAATINPIRG